MKLLLIHSNYIEYEVKDKAIKTAEPIDKKTDRLDEALTVFIAVEQIDEQGRDRTITQAAEEIIKTMDQLQITNIMLYPYAHLSSNLARPQTAQDILIKLEHYLHEHTSYTIKRSPFGWYKALTISC